MIIIRILPSPIIFSTHSPFLFTVLPPFFSSFFYIYIFFGRILLHISLIINNCRLCVFSSWLKCHFLVFVDIWNCHNFHVFTHIHIFTYFGCHVIKYPCLNFRSFQFENVSFLPPGLLLIRYIWLNVWFIFTDVYITDMLYNFYKICRHVSRIDVLYVNVFVNWCFWIIKSILRVGVKLIPSPSSLNLRLISSQKLFPFPDLQF